MPHILFNNSGADLTITNAWNTSVLPAAGDYVYFDAGSQDAVTFQTVDTNINDFAWLELTPTYTGLFATSGTPATLRTAMMVCRGEKTAYVVGHATGGAIDTLLVDSLNASLAVSVDGRVPNLVVKRGRVVVESTMTTAIDIHLVGPQAVVLVEAGKTGTTNIYMSAGTIECNAALTTLFMTGGTCDQKTATATTLNIFGGTCNYWYRDITQSSDDIAGDVRVANGGILDLTVDPRTCNTATDAFILPGGVIKTQEGQFTATGQIIRAGGRLDIL